MWRDEYRGKPRRHRGRTLNAVSCGAHWLGSRTLHGYSGRLCGRDLVAIYSRGSTLYANRHLLKPPLTHWAQHFYRFYKLLEHLTMASYSKGAAKLCRNDRLH